MYGYQSFLTAMICLLAKQIKLPSLIKNVLQLSKIMNNYLLFCRIKRQVYAQLRSFSGIGLNESHDCHRRIIFEKNDDNKLGFLKYFAEKDLLLEKQFTLPIDKKVIVSHPNNQSKSVIQFVGMECFVTPKVIPYQSAIENEFLEDIYTNQVMCGNDKLYDVSQIQMVERLHKFIVAIVWRQSKFNANVVGRGSGVLLSKNLVLTCAHNFYYNQDRISDQIFEIYPNQCGRLERSYKIQKVFIPQEYPTLKSTAYDYALVKLKQPVYLSNFISLRAHQNLNNQKLAIFGYPESKYSNVDKFSNAESVNQAGIIKSNSVIQIRPEKGQLIHSISTLPGESGSPIIMVEDSKYQKLSIIGIHKGGIKTKIQGNIFEVNSGVLISGKLLAILDIQTANLGAQMFKVYYEADEQDIKECYENKAVLLQKGTKLLRIGYLQQSMQYFTKVIQLQMNDEAANLQLGLALEKVLDKNELIRKYLKRMQKNPSDFIICNILGYLFNEKLNSSQAIYYLNKAIQICPNYSFAYNNKGIAFKRSNCISQAIACYLKAIQINPINASTYNNLGNAYTYCHNLDEAVKSYEQSIKINPKLAIVYKNLGLVFVKTNNTKKAIKSFKKALQIDPKNSSTHFLLGMALKQNNQLEEALASFSATAGLDPRYEQAYFQMGEVFRKLSAKNEAKNCYEKCLKLNPIHTDAAQELKKLK